MASSSSSSSNIVVAVRCRPLNSRELARGARGLVSIHGNQVQLSPPDANDGDPGNARSHGARAHSFAFDFSYNSMDKASDDYASQDTLFNDLGRNLLDHAFQGYNTCIFAYGQTGSGKSYSMMGYGADRGLIPLTCSALFDGIQARKSEVLSFTVEVSFIEIYNEKVRDLLNPKNKGNLKVREHPSLGPYVEDLSKLTVETFADIERLMDEGNKSRTVAATQMNETSSRSHSVFTVLLTQKKLDKATNMTGEKVSRISLVDLAGSERANSTGATGQRLKEGANINKSLTTLGKVIAALATASATPKGKKKPAAEFIPYRDSVLTWLLKDSLGGNSKTAMIAAISPADYEETLSTLRYADQAKKIQNKAVVNEDANAKLVRELQEELAMLRARVAGSTQEATYDPSIHPEKQIVQFKTSTGEIRTVTKAELQEQLEQSEKLMTEVNQTWEEKVQKTEMIQREREQALQDLGIVIEKGNVGVHTPKKMPHLVNLCEDPLMSECLLYQIKPGRTVVGNVESEGQLDIRLSGANVLPVHCFFESASDGTVTLHACEGGTTMVNGLRIGSDKPRRLQSGYRIILGDVHVFRFNHPEEVRRHRDSRSMAPSPLHHKNGSVDRPGRLPASDSLQSLDEEANGSGTMSPAVRPASPSVSAVDWSYARREAVIARLNGTDVDLDRLDDAELGRLYSDIMKVRTHRRHATGAGRPESRLSYIESVTETEDDEQGSQSASTSANLFAADTDDTSSASAAALHEQNVSLAYEERLKEVTEEMHREMEAQRMAYEAKLQAIEDARTATMTAKGAVEEEESRASAVAVEQIQQQMSQRLEEQRQEYEQKMQDLHRRAEKRRARRRSNGANELDEEDRALVTPAVARWKALRKVALAQTILSKAVLLKEANVFSRELGKGVTYQFTVIGSGGSPVSSLGSLASAIDEVVDVATPSVGAAALQLAVKVLDNRHCAVYTWTLERMQQRLQQMRRLASLLDQPSYSKHFSLEDPFYSLEPPSHSYVGVGFLPLAPLGRKAPLHTDLRIYSPYTGQQLASCGISVKVIGVASSANDYAPNLSNELAPGSHVTLEFFLDSIKGLEPSDFCSIHFQLPLDRLSASRAPGEADVITSPAFQWSSSGELRCRWRKTTSIVLSETTLQHLRHGLLPLHLFGQCSLAYLEKCERWDETKEEKPPLRPWHLARTDSDLEASTTGRRAETEMLTEQIYDVKAMLSILELSSTGQYKPVKLLTSNPLVQGVFTCRQGVQRRISLVLSHGCGRQWRWKGIHNARIGNVRLLDGRGHVLDVRTHGCVKLAGLKVSSAVEYSSNGTTVLTFDAAWDTSSHGVSFLDRLTPSGHRVLLTLSWELQAKDCVEPIPFKFDFGLTMQDRDTRRSSRFFDVFSSQKLSEQASWTYQVRLTPAKVNKAAELWRVNTSSVFVRGEEVLGQWRPRGVSLIGDFYHFERAAARLAEVANVRALLAGIPSTRLLPIIAGENHEQKLLKVLELWQQKFGTSQEIRLVQEPAWDDIHDSVSGTASPNTASKARRMRASIRDIAQPETTSQRGTLFVMSDAGDEDWQKLWGVLRKPYLTLYRASNEAEELPNVLNVSTVRVDHSPELEEVLGRKFVFGVYTPVSALFVAAPTYPEMLAWINLIDPSWQRSIQ